jgi:hypothetical protein
VDGGTVKEEDDLWNFVLYGLGGFTESASESSHTSASTIKGGLEGQAGIPLVAKAKGKVGVEHGRTRLKSDGKTLSLTPRSAAISQLRENNAALIIDDFHYLDRSFQGSIVRALKPIIFDGLPVILIAIPHRRYDAVKVEREMTGRLESIHIPSWEKPELLEISSAGFPRLNMHVNKSVSERFAEEAYGSPHLMQQFCKDLALQYHIEETSHTPIQVTKIADDLFCNVAEGTGKIVFDKLARGPRQRSDRIQRELREGGTADIYKVTLLALAKLGPGLETVEYEQLRVAIRDVLKGTIPQAHEVTRVLDKMAEIAAGDEASTPVIDWEKDDQKLHITDPFFAFYLKWGRVEFIQQVG